MDSHLDSDRLQRQIPAKFLEQLAERANRIKAEERSKIAGGAPGEKPLTEWEAGGIAVRQLPDDEQGILRISIGGGDNLPITVNYCVFRGERGACLALLRRAVAALEIQDL
jgi:hypothetical protein